MQTIIFDHAGATLQGQLAVPGTAAGPLPLVMVFPSALGLGKHALDAVQRLAGEGYLGLGIDMYGGGLYAGYEGDAGEAGVQFETFLRSPQLLRDRAIAWFEYARAIPGVDPARIAAIGYCFGGHCVLELARTGAALTAVVSFHGILTTQLPAEPGTIKAEVVAYCGDEDPHAPAPTIDGLRRELEAAGVRHQVTVFGGVEHSFTDPDAGRMNRPGISYDAMADRVSWAGTLAALETVFA
ncbi:MAG: dienelactone hydrolase family protein [Novosphingobium sp.]